jgi:hypothetical protein
MSATSLQAAIRTPKVTTGLAWNIQSERSLNPNYIINPDRALYDNYGRSSAIDTITTLTAGMDPEYRIITENELRPQYSAYLDVPQGLSGVSENEQSLIPRMYKSRANTDTLLGNTPGRYTYFGFAPTYKVDAPLRPAFSGLNPEDQSFLKEIERSQRIMDRVYATPRYAQSL